MLTQTFWRRSQRGSGFRGFRGLGFQVGCSFCMQLWLIYVRRWVRVRTSGLTSPHCNFNSDSNSNTATRSIHKRKKGIKYFQLILLLDYCYYNSIKSGVILKMNIHICTKDFQNLVHLSPWIFGLCKLRSQCQLVSLGRFSWLLVFRFSLGFLRGCRFLGLAPLVVLSNCFCAARAKPNEQKTNTSHKKTKNKNESS